MKTLIVIALALGLIGCAGALWTLRTNAILTARCAAQADDIQILRWEVINLGSEIDSMTNDIGRLQGHDVHVRTFIRRMMSDEEKSGAFIPHTITGKRFLGGIPQLESLTNQEAEEQFGTGQTLVIVRNTERRSHAVFLDKMEAWLNDPANATANEETALVFMQSLLPK